jgi:hypothetical protein
MELGYPSGRGLNDEAVNTSVHKSVCYILKVFVNVGNKQKLILKIQVTPHILTKDF